MAYSKGFGLLMTGLLAFSVGCFGEKEEEGEDGTDGTADGTDGAFGTSDGTDGTADGTDGTADGTDGTDGAGADSTGTKVTTYVGEAVGGSCDASYDIFGYNTGWCASCNYSFNADLLTAADDTCAFGDDNTDLGVAPAGAYEYSDGSTTPPLMLVLYNGSLYIDGSLYEYGGGSATWGTETYNETYALDITARGSISY